VFRLPTHVQFEITDLCNFRCSHCYHFDTNHMPKSKDLSDAVALGLVDQLINEKVYSLIITGGEPLMRPELAIEIVKRAKSAGLYVSMNTNLTLLSDDILSRLQDVGINSLLVSCPSTQPEIYNQITRTKCFERFCDKLRILVNSQLSFLVNMVVTPSNLGSVRSTAADLANLGIKRFAVTPASLNVEVPVLEALLSSQQTVSLLEDLRWCNDHLGLSVDILEPLPKCFFPEWCWEKEYSFTKRYCQAGRMSASISNCGDVRPCSHNPVVYGNLLDDSLEAIWCKMSAYRDNTIPLECNECKTLNNCLGGCRTNSMATKGSTCGFDRLATGHVTLPLPLKPISKTVCVNLNSRISIKGSLTFRREIDGYLSISSDSKHKNVTLVNASMFEFVKWIADHSPVAVSSLVDSNQLVNSSAFVTVLESLIKKEFITIEV